jgi:hypothetical protein
MGPAARAKQGPPPKLTTEYSLDHITGGYATLVGQRPSSEQTTQTATTHDHTPAGCESVRQLAARYRAQWESEQDALGNTGRLGWDEDPEVRMMRDILATIARLDEEDDVRLGVAQVLPAPPVWPSGVTVRIIGLTKASHHNGKVGRVCGARAGNDRVSVDLGDTQRLAVRRENLELVLVDEGTTATTARPIPGSTPTVFEGPVSPRTGTEYVEVRLNGQDQETMAIVHPTPGGGLRPGRTPGPIPTALEGPVSPRAGTGQGEVRLDGQDQETTTIGHPTPGGGLRQQEPQARDQSGVRGQGPGTRDQGPGARSQKSEVRGQEPGARGQEPGARGQGPKTKRQGSLPRNPTITTTEVPTGTFPSTTNPLVTSPSSNPLVKTSEEVVLCTPVPPPALHMPARGPGTSGQGSGARSQRSEVREQGPGTRGQGPGARGQGPGAKPGARGQGPKTKRQGSLPRNPTITTTEVPTGTFPSTTNPLVTSPSSNPLVKTSEEVVLCTPVPPPAMHMPARGPGTSGQGPGARSQRPEARDQGPGTRGQGPGARGQGPGAKGRGPVPRIPTITTTEVPTGTFPSTTNPLVTSPSFNPLVKTSEEVVLGTPVPPPALRIPAQGPGTSGPRPGARRQRTGAWSQGPGTRGQGPGARGQEPGAKRQGSLPRNPTITSPGTRGQGRGFRGQKPGTRWQGSGVRGQGPGTSRQGPGARSQRPRAKGQGPGTRGQGPGARGQGPKARGQASLPRNPTTPQITKRKVMEGYTTYLPNYTS